MVQNPGSNSKYLFSDLIPNNRLEAYFDVLAVGGPFYAIGMRGEDGHIKNKIDPQGPGKVCEYRVFIREEDAHNYAIKIAVRDNLNVSLFQIVTVDAPTLFNNLAVMHAAAIARGYSGVLAKTTIEYRDEWVDLDTLWTSDPGLML